ncbi:hypothetical protein MMC10_008076 [Thelotrema lepadinum]|nr:hypothetical protein [Thelotrema lepadinum]
MAINIGAPLKEGRYKVTHYISSGESGLNLRQKIYTAWAVKDEQRGRFCCIRIHDTGETSKETEAHIPFWSSLSDPENRHPGSRNVLSVLDYFWHTDSGHDSFCTVHPLHGPTFMWLKENSPGPCPWPSQMLRSLFRQALTGLAFMHEKKICQGGLDDRDIVIGYPNIDDTKEAEITKLFGQPGKQSGVSKLNDTGTASPEEPDDPEFGIMISPSSQMFSANEPPNPATTLLQYHLCNAPELFLDNQAGPAMDIWNLAALMVNIIGEFPPYAYLFADWGRDSTTSPRFLNARRTLGELPEDYLEKMKSRDVHVPPLDFDKGHLQKILTPVPEDEDKANIFSEEDYSRLAVLIRRLMQYKPSERASAREALEDPFFSSGA